MLEGAINFLGRTWGNLFHSWRKNTEIELCKEHWDRTLHQFDNPFGFNNWTFACLLFVPVTTVVVPLAARSLTAGSPPRGMRVEFWLWRIQCLPGFGKNPWGREWQPIPVFLPGKRHGQRSLAGYSPWDCKESDTTTPPLLVSPWVLFYPKTDASGTTTVGPWLWSQVCQVWGLEEGPRRKSAFLTLHCAQKASSGHKSEMDVSKYS